MENSCKIAETGLVGMLHEMNNPLTNIKLCMDLLESCNEEKKEEYYGIINKNIDNLKTAIQQLSNSFISEGFALHLTVGEF
jgi:nitrogen-specific signal transduction histidine kinase